MKRGNEDIHIHSVWNRVRIGDEQAFSSLFMQYYSDLYQYGIRIFNHPDLVKDSIQDVFLRIWEKRSTLGDARNPRAYLIASLRRRLFLNSDLHYAELTDDLMQDMEKKSFSFELSDFMEREEISLKLRQVIVQAINGLSARQRELILLRFYYKLRYSEIAQVMVVNEQTVRNFMQRILEKLREKIDFGLIEGIDYLDDIVIALLILFKKK